MAPHLIGIDTKKASPRGARLAALAANTESKKVDSLSAALLVGAIVAAGTLIPSPVRAETPKIGGPEDAKSLGLDSLRRAVAQDGGVPMPANLGDFVKDYQAAVQLGKALFWEMQVGSDGVQACASCHFHAGADNRHTNQVNPNDDLLLDHRDGDILGYFNAATVGDTHFETLGPNGRLTRNDFPFVKTIQAFNRSAEGFVGPVAGNSNDIASSMGVFFTLFDGIQPGIATDLGTPLSDPVFNINGGTNVRRVEPRNAPSVINAVFNFTNFWEGRASNRFNGRDHFGDQDPNASIFVNGPDGLIRQKISLENSALASQALGPPASSIEMSFGDPAQANGRGFAQIGRKLLAPSALTGKPIVPLGQQRVHPRDSVLGALSQAPAPGLATTYEALIQKAFADRYWNSTVLLRARDGIDYTQMQANFGLFFGLAIQLYESTLVADQTPFDRWMETGRFGPGFGRQELAGLNLFVDKGNCITCHAGPELTKASVRSVQNGLATIKAMPMAQGTALYDTGFYNISVTPTTDDIGRGDRDPILGKPLSFARQALFSRLGITAIDFPIIGNDTLPASAETTGAQVCDDANQDGICAPDEAIRPEFQRVAVDGAFKTPGLRNVELTGPYFHNGGMATLRQVVQFYNRGGNFCRFNARDLDPNIKPLGLTDREERQLVAFLTSLTDSRVKYQAAPFDHPELRIPEHGLDSVGERRLPAVGAWGSYRSLQPFLRLNPQDEIFKPEGLCTIDPA